MRGKYATLAVLLNELLLPERFHLELADTIIPGSSLKSPLIS